MREIDSLLEEIKPVLEGLLANPSDDVQTQRWLLVRQGGELDIEDPPDSDPHELLRERIDRGADAAAFVNLVPGYAEDVLTYVIAASPPDSDIRRSHVTRAEDGSVALSPWEYTV
jgi:hypothetical protein